MNVQTAYNHWAVQYDTNENKTRDLEARALKEIIGALQVSHVLEVGCGTGKNSVWLADQCRRLTAVDFSEAMLAQARTKLAAAGHVSFHQADINEEWHFTEGQYDLAGFSLVLEHIEDLDAVFRKTAAVLRPGGYVYVGELHPFKQYAGSKARFETEAGTQVLTCFTHHVSDFTAAAARAGLVVSALREYFDEDDRSGMPRILAILFQKPGFSTSL